MQSFATLLLITCFTAGFKDVQASSLSALATIRTTGNSVSKVRTFPSSSALRTIPGSTTLPESSEHSNVEPKQNGFMKEETLLADLDAILQRELSTNAPPFKFGEIIYL
jgi:hypothetical protein